MGTMSNQDELYAAMKKIFPDTDHEMLYDVVNYLRNKSVKAQKCSGSCGARTVCDNPSCEKGLEETPREEPVYAIPLSWRRGGALLEAHRIINGARQDQYGAPEDSFALIASLWTDYLAVAAGMDDYVLRAHDVALMMSLLKIARETFSHKWDNCVDGAAYMALAADMENTDGMDGEGSM